MQKLIHFGEGHFNEVELVNRKLDRIAADIKTGKRKLLNSDEALGSHAIAEQQSASGC